MSNITTSHTLQKIILSYLSTSKASKKQIYQHIKSSHQYQCSEKNIKRELKELISQKKLSKECKLYFIPNRSERSSGDDGESGSESDDESVGAEELSVPIAQRMRKRPLHDEKRNDKDDGTKEHPEHQQQVDIDEEIRRLEAELAVDSVSDDEDDSTNGSDLEYGPRKVDDSVASDKYSSGVICLSASANERIEPLPASAMPQITKKDTINSDKKKKKRKHNNEEHTINEGLKQAVEELLNNYKSRSEVEQTPWYCRICQHQASGEADFISHRESAFHITAVKEHQKKTYCRMCRKQMTSLLQFNEHLQSRPHREMLMSKRRQQQGKRDEGGRVRGSGRGYGRGFGRGGRHEGSSKRQWC